MSADDVNINKKCKVDVKVWSANTSKKHPLGNENDPDLITYAFAGIVKSSGYGLIHYSENDRVTGLITSLDLRKSSLWLPKELEIDPTLLAPIPPEVNPADCVASLLTGLKIFTAFRQITPLNPNENILVWCHDDLNSLCIVLQLCRLWNYRAIALVTDDKAERTLRSLVDPEVKILRLNPNNIEKTIAAVNNSTGDRGVFVVLDLCYEENSIYTINPSDFISCLSIFGHFATDRHSLLLSPLDANLLHLKSANVRYLFPETWILSPLHLGKYQQILRDIMDRLKDKSIRPKIDKTIEIKDPSSADFILNSNKNCVVYKNLN